MCHTTYDSCSMHNMYDFIKGKYYIINMTSDLYEWVRYSIHDYETKREIQSSIRPMDLKKYFYTKEQMRDIKINQAIDNEI